MVTANVAKLELMEHRLDSLDCALMGLMGRSERLQFVAGIESKIRELHESNPTALEELLPPQEEVGFVHHEVGRMLSTSARKRSRLAFTSGVLGIVVLALMFAMPLTYCVVAMAVDTIGEVPAIAIMSLNVLAVGCGGAIAIAMAIVSLVRLNHRQGRHVGQGWAITGLCTATVPMLVGLLAALFFMLPMAIAVANRSNNSGEHYCSAAPNANSPTATMARCTGSAPRSELCKNCLPARTNI